MKLSTGHRRWVYWSAAGLLASGALWLAFHYLVRTRGEFGDTAHPLEIWWLRLHGGFAMLALVVMGSLLPVHVRRGWHQRKNLFAGCMLGALALLLITTGYALYYIGDEVTRPWISALHWGVGLGAPLVLIWHVWRGRRARSALGQYHSRGRPAAEMGPDPTAPAQPASSSGPSVQSSRPSISA
jgi:hypothetical protein